MSKTMQATIEARAYGLWEHEGRPEGRSLEHWLRAEAEVGSAAKLQRARKPKSARAA